MNSVQDSKEWHLSQAPTQTSPTAVVGPSSSPKPSSSPHSYGNSAPQTLPSPKSTQEQPEQTSYSPESDSRILPGMIAQSQPSTPRPTKQESPVYPLAVAPYPPRNVMRGRSNLFSIESSPTFTPSKPYDNLYAADRSTLLSIRVQSKVDRGFFLAENDWTCYRRNYFQVSSVFSIHGFSHYHSVNEPQVYVNHNKMLQPVNRFLLGISARVANSDKDIEIIQHTPKRDKGPQFRPDPKPITPGGNLSMSTVANNQSVVTFERVQFKTATANNGKRRAAQQYYICNIELYAETEARELVAIASCQSDPLVVRGRSPGHYADTQDRSQQQQQYQQQPQQHTPPATDGRDMSSGYPSFSRPPMTPPSTMSNEGYSYYTAYSHYPSPNVQMPPNMIMSNNQTPSDTSVPTSQQPHRLHYIVQENHNPHGHYAFNAPTDEPKVQSHPFNMQIPLDYHNSGSGYDWQRARYNSASSGSSTATSPPPGQQDTNTYFPQSQRQEQSPHQQSRSYSPNTPTMSYSGRKYNAVPNLCNTQAA
ncbi:p53-like transcription factor [Backusella circina FSU 941]|nr:p53-like transcription factor [Backusella circina FSU 941]